MAEWYEVCAYCGRRIDFSGAAVVLGEPGPSYQPSMEDWRGGYVSVAHPECFAEAEGVEALMTAVDREDARRAGRLGPPKDE